MGPARKEDGRKRCLDNSREDCEVLGLSVSVAEKLANDRLVWIILCIVIARTLRRKWESVVKINCMVKIISPAGPSRVFPMCFPVFVSISSKWAWFREGSRYAFYVFLVWWVYAFCRSHTLFSVLFISSAVSGADSKVIKIDITVVDWSWMGSNAAVT